MSIVNSNNFLHKTVDGVKQFFSPLVHAATVVLKDGTRLEKDGKIHADTTDDSKKLNGKEPKYYIQPRNLLDNSNFCNPVNQRGQKSYMGATYTIDRWYLSTDSVGGNVSIDNHGLMLDRNTINGYTFLQYIEKLDTSKVYTFAVKDVVGNVYMIHSVPNERKEETTSFGTIIAKTQADALPAFGITLNNETNITLVWAALYEGEYTTNNLPPYVYKGYAAELAECQRYLRIIGAGGVNANMHAGYAQAATTTVLNACITIGDMRLAAPSYQLVGNCVIRKGTADTTVSITDMSVHRGVAYIQLLAENLTAGNMYALRFTNGGRFIISADL